MPLAAAGPDEPRFGGDHQLVGVGVQGLADQVLGDIRAVGVGGVDQADTELDGPSQYADRLLTVTGLAPDALAREAHRAVAEPDDWQVAADVKAPALDGWACACIHGHGSLIEPRQTPRPRRHPRARRPPPVRTAAPPWRSSVARDFFRELR